MAFATAQSDSRRAASAQTVTPRGMGDEQAAPRAMIRRAQGIAGGAHSLPVE